MSTTNLIEELLETRRNDELTDDEISDFIQRSEKIRNFEEESNEWKKENFPPIPYHVLFTIARYILERYEGNYNLIQLTILDVKDAIKEYFINTSIFDENVLAIYADGWENRDENDYILREIIEEMVEDYLLPKYNVAIEEYEDDIEFPEERIELENLDKFLNAIIIGDIDQMDSFLNEREDFDLNVRRHFYDQHNTEIIYFPLIIAANSGNIYAVKLLLDRGANININNGEPLQKAVRNNNLEMVEFLIKNGANINANHSYALEIALDRDYTDIAEVLILKDADTRELSRDNLAKVEAIREEWAKFIPDVKVAEDYEVDE